MPKQLDKINQQLQDLHEEKQLNSKLGIRIKEIYTQLKKLASQVKKRKSKLENERSDFERYQKYNTSKLFRAILGGRETQLEKERQEYLQAALEYNSTVDTIELLEFELDVIHKKYRDESALELKLNDLVKKKEQKLKSFDLIAAKSISRFDTKIFDQRALIIDIIEAEQIGIECQQLLNAIIRNLNKVRNWGYSNFGGQGSYSTYAKRSFIEKSRMLIANTNVKLGKFSKELSDVYKNIDEQVESKFKLDTFDNFINIFFDNLITDWIIQQKIFNALKNIKAVLQMVNRLLTTLKTDHQLAIDTITSLEKEKTLFIINL